MPEHEVEELITRLVEMGRADLVTCLRQVDVGFQIDFTDEYLDYLPLDRLRHIVLAACLNARRGKPETRNSKLE